MKKLNRFFYTTCLTLASSALFTVAPAHPHPENVAATLQNEDMHTEILQLAMAGDVSKATQKPTEKKSASSHHVDNLPPVTVTELPKDQDTGVKLLQFVMAADIGTAKLTDSKQSIYTITLHHTHKRVSYFTNEPRRIVGSMSVNFFLKRWQKPAPHDYKTTPPNFVMLYTPDNSKANTKGIVRRKMTFVQLMSPVYNSQDGTTTFTVKSVENKPLALPEKFITPVFMFASPTVCGLIGAWGNLPGEKQYNQDCHTTEQKKFNTSS